MARRTISLTPGFENAIRRWQTEMMLTEKRDVTFTEALHGVLFRAFLPGYGVHPTVWWKGEPHRKVVADDVSELFEGWGELPQQWLLDSLPEATVAALNAGEGQATR